MTTQVEPASTWENFCWNKEVVVSNSINLYAFILYSLPKVINLVDTFQPISQAAFGTLLKNLSIKAFLSFFFFYLFSQVFQYIKDLAVVILML